MLPKAAGQLKFGPVHHSCKAQRRHVAMLKQEIGELESDNAQARTMTSRRCEPGLIGPPSHAFLV
jgi:hypothetical protein